MESAEKRKKYRRYLENEDVPVPRTTVYRKKIDQEMKHCFPSITFVAGATTTWEQMRQSVTNATTRKFSSSLKFP